MPDDRIKNRLDKINRNLYDRKKAPINLRRASFTHDSTDIRHDWHDENMPKKKGKFTGLELLLMTAAVFFIISVGYAAFSFKTGKNIVSPGNVEIAIKGPISIKGGEELTLQLEVTNKNSVDIESVDLSVSYPPGTRSAENIDKEEQRYRNFIGTIKSGETVKQTVKAVLFGDENEEKKITVRVEYRTAGSSAIVPVVKDYVEVITSAPVHVTLSLPKDTNNGKEVPVEVTVTSNSSQTIKDVYLEIDIPDGFKISSSKPEPVFGRTLWSLGDLPPGISQTVKILGKITGEDNDALSFTATAGLRRNDNDRGVSVPYSTDKEAISIRPAFVGLGIILNSVNGDELVARPGSDVRGQLVFSNRLSSEIRDGILSIKFDGPILDQNQVSVQDGFYDSQDDSIIWKPQDISLLDSLASGAQGKVDFDFAFIDTKNITALGLTNPTLSVTANFSGTRTSSGFEGQAITRNISTKIKMESALRVLAQGFYTGGPFINTGPLPPKVKQETTYTVTLSVSNTFNKVNNVIVTGTLPTYVKWLDVISDPNEKLTYNSANGKVTWNVGDLNAYVGSQSQAREISFRVSITPSLSQRNDYVNLIDDIMVSGKDNFTQTNLSGSSRAVTTSNIVGITGSQGLVTQ